MIAATAVRAIAATLPAGVRDRYREEWLADAEGAAEAGLGTAGVVAGALGVAVRIDREHPSVSGMPPARLAFRRLRVVIAFGCTALLLTIAGVFWGASTGFDSRGVVPFAELSWTGRAVMGAIAGSLVVALVALVGTVRAAVRAAAGSPARGLGAAALVVLVALVLGVAIAAFVPLLGMLLVFPLLVVPLVLVAIKDPRTQGAPLRAAARIGIAAASAAAILLVVAGGLLHIFVWNPLERLPGMTLDEIYARLAAARELPSPVFAAMWAGFWALVALALLVIAIAPPRGLRRFLTARRLAGAGLLGVALAAGGVWIAGFGMGMGMADAFATSGGDAAASGPVLAAVGVGYAIAALLVGLLPTSAPSAVSKMQEN